MTIIDAFRSTKTRPLVSLIGAITVIAVTMSTASSTSLTLAARADASVVVTAPNLNRGDLALLRVREDNKLTYLRFDVPAPPSGEAVVSATLNLFATSANECGGVEVRRGADNFWQEASIDWNNQPGSTGPAVDSATWDARGVVSLDITSVVDGSGPVTVVLSHVAGCDATISDGFVSREGATNQPELVIETGPASPADTITLAAAGDIACDPNAQNFSGSIGASCQHRATADLLAGADAVVPLGDMQYSAARLDQLTLGYDPSWGRFSAVTYPVPGNHEYETAGAAGYFDYWTSKARPTGVGDSGFYSYDLGAWHVIALNSASGCCVEGSAQDTFLERDLAATTQRCIVAYWHHPLFNSGSVHGDEAFTRPLWNDLYAAGADVVLNGHEHNYQRYAKQSPTGAATSSGIREFVVGSGGKGHYGLGSAKDANFEFGNATDFGVLELELDDGSYSWRFVGIDGSVLDAGGPVPCN